MKVCVFCSSSNALSDIYFQEANQLGILLATRGHSLVYGGANVGLMDQIAITVKEHGAHVTGIIPQKIFDRNLATIHANELIVTDTMDERKSRMREISDAFIAMPGGFGTLEEILEVITLKQLDYHRKPIVFINTKGFYNDLFAQFEKSYSELFAKENYRLLYFIAGNADEAVHYIENYTHADLGTKWFKVPIK